VQRPARLAAASLLGLFLVPAAHASEAPRVPEVAAALDRDPVYVAPSEGDAVRPSAARRLRRRIARLDRGRIQVAVVPRASADRVGGIRSFANAVDQVLPSRRGSLITTTGGQFQIVTSHTGVEPTLAAVRRAVDAHREDGLAQQLLASVEGVAEVDPGPGADVNGPPAGSGGTRVPSAGTSDGGGSDAAEIVGIVVGALVLVPLLVVGIWLLLRWRARRREAAEMEELDLGSARDELLALGQDIQDLDIDTQMPNASAAGLQEYQRALMLYDRGNRALAHEDPSQLQLYEAKHAAEEGRARIQAARTLLGGDTVHPPP